MNVVAYCLMPNHFHFLLQPQKTGTLSDFRHRLQLSYAQATNKRYKRTGPLFENRERFQHKHVYSERYQILLCRYIHVNPLKDGLVQRLEDWALSNYFEFIETRRGKLFMPGFREKFFAKPAAYAEFVTAYGTEEEKELEGWLNLQ